jgi:hypothetical protein
MTVARRISITMERTELTISITQHVAPGGAISAEGPGPPELCPQCGGAWIANFQATALQGGIGPGRLQAAAAGERLHLHCSAQGEVWICERSLEELKNS